MKLQRRVKGMNTAAAIKTIERNNADITLMEENVE
jgi:hypothetical protein